MTELGWQGLALPEEWGGQGLGMVELAVVLEEMGYALAPSPLLSNTVAGLALATCADDDQKERYLRPLAEGERRGTPALFDAGTPATSASSTMEARSDGDGVVLDGEKVLVMDAGSADFFLVATSDGRRHLVDRDAEGVSVTPGELDRPRPAGCSGPLRRGPGRRRATPAGRGRRLPPGLPSRLRRALGGADRDRPADDGDGDRVRQGPPAVRPGDRLLPGRLPPLRADAAGDRELALGRLLRRLGRRRRAGNLPRAASIAKAYASDAGWRVAAASIQVHGGIGFTWEHDLHFWLKRATADASMFGDAKWHRERVAERVLAGVGEVAAVA